MKIGYARVIRRDQDPAMQEDELRAAGCEKVVREKESDAKSERPGLARVIVTFVEPRSIALQERGIDEEQAAKLRGSLAAFAEDWESPEMGVYDDYDAARA